jgi:tetratricopeptide (TPR) repeat protein
VPPRVAAPPQPPASIGTTLETSDPALAEALLIERVEPTPANYVRTAREYLRLGVLDAAYSKANQAVELDPRCADAHELMARTWRTWGFLDRALGAAYRATFYAPRSASAANTLGTVLDAMGKTELAIAAYRRALALDASAAWTLSNACYAEFRIGHLDDARRFCQSALAIDSTLAAAHNNLALTFAAGGDFAGARTEFLAAGDSATAD